MISQLSSFFCDCSYLMWALVQSSVVPVVRKHVVVLEKAKQLMIEAFSAYYSERSEGDAP